MLLIRKEQMEVLLNQKRQSFVRNLMVHLARCEQPLSSEVTKNYTAPLAIQQVEKAINYLQNKGFTKEKNLVEVIELIELYDMPLIDAQVKRIIDWQEYSVQDRIDLLFYLCRARGLL